MGVFNVELYRMLEIFDTPLDSEGEFIVDWKVIGLDRYPIYDEAHRAVLNKKILDRYLNREIGQETIEKFQHNMRRRMNEIMPAYNQLYETTLIEFNPLHTIDMLTTSNETGDTTSEAVSNGDTESTAGAKSRAINSDFPQFQLAGNADYATSGADTNASNTATGSAHSVDTGSVANESESESRSVGYQGSPAELIMRARSAIINIDLAIVEDVRDLFMIVWDNGDEWLPSNWKGIAL